MGLSICKRMVIAGFLFSLIIPSALAEDFTYTTNNGAITITGYTGSGGSVVIPGSINGLPVTGFGNVFRENITITNVTIGTNVTSIGTNAFVNCAGLKSVTIPNSVTNIGSWAFGYCAGLTSITIPNSITSIGFDAFRGCNGLTSVTIPSSVTSIGDHAFYYCRGLSTITVEDENSVYSSTNGVLFNKSQTTIIQYPGGKAGSYTIPSGVTSIGVPAFSGCTGLTSVTIPDSVTSISGTFSYCTSLRSVTIPNSVTSIGPYMFFNCTSLTNATIGSGVTNIVGEAFRYCANLTRVYFQGAAPAANSTVFTNTPAVIYRLYLATGWPPVPNVWAGRPTAYWGPIPVYQLTVNNGTGSGSYTNGSVVTIVADTAPSGQLFDRWTGATQHVANVTAPSTAVTIPATAIAVTATYRINPAADFTYVTNNGAITITGYTGSGGGVTIPGTINSLPVTSIGDWAFSGNTNMTGVTIPDSVTNIGIWAFGSCTGLTSVTIPDGITSIGDWAFPRCYSMTNVIIGNSVTSIGTQAFAYCGLRSVTIPDSVTSIGTEAFLDCIGLTNAIIGNSVYSIGNNAFYNTGLQSVMLPARVSIIGERSFYNCTGLTNVIIGNSSNSVTSIGAEAFRGCLGLTSITIPDSVTSIGDGAFYGCLSLANAIIGNSVTRIWNDVFSGCTGLTNVVIGNSVTSIGYYVFRDCLGLTSITIPDSVTSIGDGAFSGCTGLTGVYFQGASPAVNGNEVFLEAPATVYRLYGAAGWPTVPSLWAGRPTAYWGYVPTSVIGVSGNLAFGNVITGTTFTATLILTNSGDATLTVTGITYPAGFSGAWSGAIAAGGSHTVTVTFAPVAVTAYSGTVTVNSDKTSGTNTISASGAGIAASVYEKAITGFRLTTANSGTLIGGPSWVAGRYGNGLRFSSGQYVTVPAPAPDVLNITNDLTLAVWVKPNSVTCSGADPGFDLIAKRTSNSSTPYELYIGNGGTVFLNYWATSIAYPIFVASGTVSTGVWQHIAVTRSFSGANATVKFYINGVAAGCSTQASGRALGSSAPVWLARGPYHATYTSQGTYSGSMDDVQIYNRALSAQEVSRIVSNNSASIMGRVGCWRLDETNGTTAADTIADGVVNEGSKTVSVLVPGGTDRTALVPRITTSPLTTISPLSGVARNFGSPVVYTVTAEDLTTQNYTVTVAYYTDGDGNGIPDAWEQQYFGGAGVNPNAVCSNGINTIAEAYVAGLNPTNSLVRFGITNHIRNLIQWNAVSGRVYNVYWATNLMNKFEILQTNYTGGAITDSLHNASGKCFYKIDVRLAP